MILVLILSLMTTFHSVKAININLDPLIDQINFKYPEEKNKDIRIHKAISKLDSESPGRNKIEKLFDQYNPDPEGDIMEQITKFGFNKFSMGTGIVDVTFQVKNGVEYALKDTLAGYPEFQRRKITEEMLNANFRSHKITNNFLIGSSSQTSINSWSDLITSVFDIFSGNSDNFLPGKQAPSLLETIKIISHKAVIQDIYHFFQAISYALLGLITMLIVFQRLHRNEFHIEYTVTIPLINAIAATLVIATVGEFLDLILSISNEINSALIGLIFNMFNSSSTLDYTQLAHSWQALVNKVGYMPGLVLSIIDLAAQFFSYFFIAGLILSVIIGKILSPLWGLALVSESLRSSSLQSFIEWSKTTLVIALIPVSYLVMKFIIQEFSNLDLFFLEVSLSIASFLYLPAFFNIILAKGNGVLEPAFSGYQNLVDNINQSYQGLRSAIEKLA